MLLHYVACSYYTIYNGALVKKKVHLNALQWRKCYFICFWSGSDRIWIPRYHRHPLTDK
uniref:Uncharacterized protein n=1 Tax=Anguilla anguilla TaxID=7936 RepID=A0A0E9UTB3_ANGAN